MTEELERVIDDYIDGFMASELMMVKITDKKYPLKMLKKAFLDRIKERELKDITAYTFLNELFLEKI